MHKDTLREILKTKSMSFTLEEIEEIMDEELDKSPEEMDTELVDLCADILEKASLGVDKQNFADRKKGNNLKEIKIKRIILIAALVAIFFSIVIPIGAKYFHLDASDKLVNYDGDRFKLDLKEGKTDAEKHSDDSIDIVKKIQELGIDEVILPSVLLSDEYEKTISFADEDDSFITIVVKFTSETINISGDFSLSKFKSRDNLSAIGLGNVSNEFNSVNQLTINGMDIIIFSNEKRSYINYVDNDVSYSIHLNNCNLDCAIEIVNSLE